MALTAYFANNKALRIKLAPAAAGITEYMGLWWELLLLTAASIPLPQKQHSSSLQLSPPFTPIATPRETNFNSTFRAEKPDVMFAIKKYKLQFEGHLLQYSPE